MKKIIKRWFCVVCVEAGVLAVIAFCVGAIFSRGVWGINTVLCPLIVIGSFSYCAYQLHSAINDALPDERSPDLRAYQPGFFAISCRYAMHHSEDSHPSREEDNTSAEQLDR